MQYTEQQKAGFREQFATRRRRQLIATVPAIGLILVLSFIGNENRTVAGLTPDVIMGLCLVVIVGIMIFSLRNWRCPSCNGYLGRAINPKFCSRCGAELR